MTRDGAVILVVKLPDGRSERVPASWTEATTDGPTMPDLLFSPSSLRAQGHSVLIMSFRA